jgi:membrane-associated phospholipid phosphatase
MEQSPSVTIGLPSGAAAARVRCFRASKTVAVAYFLYLALLAAWRGAGRLRVRAAGVILVAVWGLAAFETRCSRRWSQVARDWLPLPLILVGYWQLEWFSAAPLAALQQRWLALDQLLLGELGLRRAIESLGWVLPALLEVVYFSLYAIPALCLGALYKYGRRDRAPRFLLTLFLGAFAAYALLPHFPAQSPRVAFPGLDLPAFAGFWRGVNTWLLDHLDISTGVFPSGHVAVAFSAAFGLLGAIPARRLAWGVAFAAAALVFTATVYCRYHYAVDGLASIAISLAAWRASAALERYDA